jgi:hypothetical protein
VVGWLADFFRLAWGLLYWNARKTQFRLSRGRMRCPCQSPSDSGRALETNCGACMQRAKPARFKRVCPLLTETPHGLRCAANTADVRPFWNLTGLYYGGTLAAIYLAGVIGVFGFLRIVGYPISIVHVARPGLWHRVPQARGWFFVERANRAFAAGKTSEGLLFLVNAFEFDPRNYAVGLTLARHYQLLQPTTSDQFYDRLMREFPGQRDTTSQDWYRALIARGDFVQAATLAALGDLYGALDLLGRRQDVLGQTARYTLELDILAAAGFRGTLLRNVEMLLGQSQRGTEFMPTVALLCGHLVRHPDPEIFARLTQRIAREPMDFNNDTAGVWFLLVCAAGAVADRERLHSLILQLKRASKSSFAALDAVEAFFRGEGGARRATSFLPVLPLPLDVAYAMLDRFPGQPPATPAKKS